MADLTAAVILRIMVSTAIHGIVPAASTRGTKRAIRDRAIDRGRTASARNRAPRSSGRRSRRTARARAFVRAGRRPADAEQARAAVDDASVGLIEVQTDRMRS